MEREQKWFVVFILLAGVDSLLERRILGDMSIPFFSDTGCISLLRKEIGRALFNGMYGLWLVGGTLVAALLLYCSFPCITLMIVSFLQRRHYG